MIIACVLLVAILAHSVATDAIAAAKAVGIAKAKGTGCTCACKRCTDAARIEH